MVVSLLVKVGRCILWQPLIICVFLCAISDHKTAPKYLGTYLPITALCTYHTYLDLFMLHGS